MGSESAVSMVDKRRGDHLWPKGHGSTGTPPHAQPAQHASVPSPWPTPHGKCTTLHVAAGVAARQLHFPLGRSDVQIASWPPGLARGLISQKRTGSAAGMPRHCIASAAPASPTVAAPPPSTGPERRSASNRGRRACLAPQRCIACAELPCPRCASRGVSPATCTSTARMPVIRQAGVADPASSGLRRLLIGTPSRLNPPRCNRRRNWFDPCRGHVTFGAEMLCGDRIQIWVRSLHSVRTLRSEPPAREPAPRFAAVGERTHLHRWPSRRAPPQRVPAIAMDPCSLFPRPCGTDRGPRSVPHRGCVWW